MDEDSKNRLSIYIGLALTIGLMIGIVAGYAEFYSAGKFCCDGLKECLNTTVMKAITGENGGYYMDWMNQLDNKTFLRAVK
jgi:hypothetical protein